MAVMETKILISGEDKTSVIIDALVAKVAGFEKHLDAVSKQIGGIDRLGTSFNKLGPSAISASNAIEKIAPMLQKIGVSTHNIDKLGAAFQKAEGYAKGLANAGRNFGAAITNPSTLLGGYSGYQLGKAAIHQASNYMGATTNMRMAGFTPDQIAEAQDKALEISTKYPNVSQLSVMNNLISQRAITGSFDEAMNIVEESTKLRSIMNTKDPTTDADHMFELLNKGIEILNKAKNPVTHQKAITAIAKTLNTFNKTLPLDAWYQMAQRSGLAGQKLDNDFLFNVMPTIASEMGGDQAGTALATTYQAIVGGRMSHNSVEAMDKLHLLDSSKIVRTSTGSIKGLQQGAVKNWRTFMENPNKWVHDDLAPILDKMDEATANSTIATIFSNRNAQKFIGMLYAQEKTKFAKDRELLLTAEGTEAADKNKTRDFATVATGFTNAMDGMLAAFGSPLAQAAIPVINGLTAAMNELTSAAKAHPELAALSGLGAIGGAAVGAAALGGMALKQIGKYLGIANTSAGAAAETGVGDFALSNILPKLSLGFMEIAPWLTAAPLLREMFSFENDMNKMIYNRWFPKPITETNPALASRPNYAIASDAHYELAPLSPLNNRNDTFGAILDAIKTELSRPANVQGQADIKNSMTIQLQLHPDAAKLFQTPAQQNFENWSKIPLSSNPTGRASMGD